MAKARVTLEQIEALDKDMLVPTDIAPYLGCCSYTINVATEGGKNPFPFPVIRMGRRVRIPKMPFIRAMRGSAQISNEKETEHAQCIDNPRSCPAGKG